MDGAHSQQQLKSVVVLAHSFAVALLKKKLSAGRLNLTLVEMDVNDIAYDCIAELFRFDDNNIPIQLKSYFDSLPLSTLSNEMLVDQFRRLVFSKVNHGMFRLYSEYDTSLGKILRNIKLTVHSLGNFIEVERFGELYLVPSFGTHNFNLPQITCEELELRLRELLHGNERIPDVLAALSRCLHEESDFAKAVPLVGFAIVLRKIFSEEFSPIQDEQPDSFSINDLKNIIIQSADKIKTTMSERYVANNKISNEEYYKLFSVIEKNLFAIIVQNDGVDFSLYEHLEKEIPGLTKEKYIQRYKAVIEYLLSLTKKEIGKQLKQSM